MHALMVQHRKLTALISSRDVGFRGVPKPTYTPAVTKSICNDEQCAVISDLKLAKSSFFTCHLIFATVSLSRFPVPPPCKVA